MGRVSYTWEVVQFDDFSKVYIKFKVEETYMQGVDLFLVDFDGTWWRGIHRGETIVKGRVKDNVINQSEQWMDEHE